MMLRDPVIKLFVYIHCLNESLYSRLKGFSYILTYLLEEPIEVGIVQLTKNKLLKECS